MDVTGIAHTATALKTASIQQEAGIAILKKAMDINAAGALKLLEAIPDSRSLQNLPAHLGQSINTTA